MKTKIKKIFLYTGISAVLFFSIASLTYLLLNRLEAGPLTGLGKLKEIKIPRAYIVQSGSMQPTINTGSLVISLPQSSYNQGDVITYRKDGGKTLVTHRINFKLYKEGIGLSATYVTSGDANEDFDTWVVKDEYIIGKAVFTLPYLGYVADFAKQPYGFLLLVIVPATIIIYEELKSLLKEIAKFIKKVFLKISSKLKKAKNPDISSGIHFRSEKDLSAQACTPQRDTSILYTKIGSIIPIFGALLVFAGLASSFFNDIESSIGNILGAAESFDQNGNDGQDNGGTVVEDNPSCQSLGYTFGFKINGSDIGNREYTLTSTDGELTGGAPEDPNNSISLSNVVIEEDEKRFFDWAATLGIDAVIVKGGNNANLYTYDPEAFSDTGLHAPLNSANDKFFGISHIEFCYDYDVFVNELLPNPSGDEALNEWIELYNSSSSSQSLSGWTINDTVGVTVSASLAGKTINGNAYLIIERPESGITLNNSGDGVELRFSSVLIDSVSYTSDPGTDVSIGREPDGTGPFAVCNSSTKGTSNTGICQP